MPVRRPPHFGARVAARFWLLLVALAGFALGLLMAAPGAAFAQEGLDEPATRVDTEAELRAAWADLTETHIELTDDIFLHQCKTGDPIRESPYPLLLDGKGHTIRQTCFEKRVLRQDGTGYLLLKNVKLTRGGSDGPGAAVTTRGEIKVVDSKVQQNLAEEPGGGIFSMRRATIIRSVITNNLANDDGGGVYARRGGVQVFDSTISNNLVDGSGGAIGSTGDILLVRSHSDGNTTDGDGGALYADEDGDVTVVDSTVDGSDADGPGGAIWTLEGDVTVVGSTLNGNRADDRGGAIGGEADVFVINSTVARNAAVAHVARGIFSRGNLYVANSTVSNNYAEGQGGGILGWRHGPPGALLDPEQHGSCGGQRGRRRRTRILRLGHRSGEDHGHRGTGPTYREELPPRRRRRDPSATTSPPTPPAAWTVQRTSWTRMIRFWDPWGTTAASARPSCPSPEARS